MSQSDEQKSTDTDYSPELRDNARKFYIAAINRDLKSATEILQRDSGIAVVGEYQYKMSHGVHRLHHSGQCNIAEILNFIELKGDTVRLGFNGNLGITAWEWAIKNNDKDLLKIFLEKSTILNDPRRFSCAFRSGASGEITECLLKWVKRRDNYNEIINRTLFDAVHEDNEAVVFCLIQNNANVNITDPGIPLSIAAERASPRIVTLLLENDASVIKVDKFNKMAHEIAADRKSYDPYCEDAIEVSAILEDAFRIHQSISQPHTSDIDIEGDVVDSSDIYTNSVAASELLTKFMQVTDDDTM